MTLYLFNVNLVIAVHDAVLNPGELPGLALDKSLDGALGRVEHRLHYGMLADPFDLAAAYCVAVATGHCFNDGNKRTAFRVMDLCLRAHGVQPEWGTEDVGQKVIAVAQGKVEAEDLAAWLRGKAGE